VKGKDHCPDGTPVVMACRISYGRGGRHGGPGGPGRDRGDLPARHATGDDHLDCGGQDLRDGAGITVSDRIGIAFANAAVAAAANRPAMTAASSVATRPGRAPARWPSSGGIGGETLRAHGRGFCLLRVWSALAALFGQVRVPRHAPGRGRLTPLAYGGS
jgi:hypothetical protein